MSKFGDWLMNHNIGDKVKDKFRDLANEIMNGVIPLERLHAELDNTNDPIVSKLHELNQQEIVARIDRNGQRRQWNRFPSFALWVFLDDPAHRHQFLHLLKLILDNEDYFRDALDSNDIVNPPPERWYVNIHERSEEETKEARESGAPEDRNVGTEEILTMGEKKKELAYQQDRKEDGVVINDDEEEGT
jgi:hypothetical protein